MIDGGDMQQSMRVFSIIAGVTALLLTASCNKQKAQPAEVLRPVKYQPLYATGGTRIRTFSGVAKPGVESNLSFKVGGTIQRVAVKVGDTVQSGKLIATLDPRDYELKVQELQASLQQSQAQARNARASYERTQSLYESRNASINDLDAARAASESAEAAVQSLQKRLEQAKLQRGYARLEAPIAGAIAEVNVDVNENVRAGQTIAVLTSGAQLEVEVGVPEILIARVREGDAVSITFDALGDQKLPGRITEVGVASTGAVSTYPVTLTVLEQNANIRAGMAAEVAFTFKSDDQRERFIVPPVAVGADRDGRFVMLVRPSEEEGVGVVERHNVTIGELTSEGLEISGDIADGDNLITAGVSKIHDGMKVKFHAASEPQS
jgi:RND family efflux transporter MFP subunit